ncbi:MAG: cytochrome d ubiquinol oxidase subunit II [Thermomonas hydrothermalis]|uniref:cytochrome d ubiquinol oxidase subunit II n=1 Tax=Thermomonas hydrothermalis TaxID=213588 RepID=UPI0023576F1B|nr:cytochrome d ubiquinol oxidase subunit II [Thermomonas hydrothermalis]MCL6618971.1 cytochrome d ubiquinol oxidase subunit II [Thermomonas hydrothermalis]
MFDYATLREIWWLLLGVLLIGFALTDGYDLGLGAIYRFITRDDVERRMALEAIEPHWEGHQVWFILGGGAVFAAWPLLYAASFSGFYFAMLLVLLALILRPVGFNFRNKVSDPRWRNAWDWALTVAGAVPSLVFGVAFGNLFLGVPFHFTDTLRPVYDGSFFGLFHPFALLAGVVSLAMLVMHGASFGAMKIEGAVGDRARRVARGAAVITLLVFVAAGVWLSALPGHAIVGQTAMDGPSNPLAKQVTVQAGAWLANQQAHPLLWLVPALAALGMLGVIVLRNRVAGFISSCLAVAGVILTAGIALFPFLMPSSVQPAHGLTVWDASSSARTLGIMLFAATVFLPLILAYSTWAFRIMRGQVTRAHVEEQARNGGGY